MAEFFTAQCDAQGLVLAVTRTTRPLVAPQGKIFVELESHDTGLVGWTWDGTYFIEPVEEE